MPFFNVFIKIIKDVRQDEVSFIRNTDDKHRVIEVIYEQLSEFKVAFDLFVYFDDFGELQCYFSIYKDRHPVDPTMPLFSLFQGEEHIYEFESEHIGLFVHVGIELVDVKKNPYEEGLFYPNSNGLGLGFGMTKYAKKAKKPNKAGSNCWSTTAATKWFESKAVVELNYIV